MMTLMVVEVTPDHVAPPLSPPAQVATHGGCSLRPVMQNGLPVVWPLAGAATPRCLAAVLPLAPTGVLPVEPTAPGVLDEPLTAPGVVAPGVVAPGRVGADDDCDVGAEPLNWPPMGPLADDPPLDGATTTSTICAMTSKANGAYRRSPVTAVPPVLGFQARSAG